jgi:hypothetical protein
MAGNEGLGQENNGKPRDGAEHCDRKGQEGRREVRW